MLRTLKKAIKTVYKYNTFENQILIKILTAVTDELYPNIPFSYIIYEMLLQINLKGFKLQ